jgi:OOP family OmpA-OmpF porin
VRFQTNAATLAPESHAVLLAVAAELQRHPEIRRIEVAGHTDAQGNADYNLALSQVRAEEVRRFLIEQGGLSPDRVLARGFGEAAPIDRNDTVSGRARNRRVEFLVVDPAPRG